MTSPRLRALLLATLALAMASPAAAQISGRSGRPGGGGDDNGQQQDDAKRKKRDSEWNSPKAPLPQLRNAGPCPFVKVLYDAARYVEFDKGREASTAAGFTGEIQGVSAACQYKDTQPIRVAVELLFELGKGPMAQGREKTYRYWVAVTQRNQAVLSKEYFDIKAEFEPGQDRTFVRDKLAEIVIPRANMQVSGSNFEVLVGFDVTPEMAAFNRDGKRFRVNAGQVAQASAPAAPVGAAQPQ